MSKIPSDFQDGYKFTHFSTQAVNQCKRKLQYPRQYKSFSSQDSQAHVIFSLSSSKDKQFAEFGFKMHGKFLLDDSQSFEGNLFMGLHVCRIELISAY